MAILWLIDGNGGLLVGNTDNECADYSYPTSTNAVEARRNPQKVALRKASYRARYAWNKHPKSVEWMAELRKHGVPID